MELTERERQTLQYMADGAATRVMARGMSIAVGTVHRYRSQVIRKMGAANGFNAVAIGIREGIIK